MEVVTLEPCSKVVHQVRSKTHRPRAGHALHSLPDGTMFLAGTLSLHEKYDLVQGFRKMPLVHRRDWRDRLPNVELKDKE